ncbi:hypothetical protein [Paenibacillus pabuli]|uniref:hypothetical protein n=1 Tax=Paenibacillus pabuli TaxID=1472 RepID=UPI003459373A
MFENSDESDNKKFTHRDIHPSIRQKLEGSLKRHLSSREADAAGHIPPPNWIAAALRA